jgi:pilus assembly protein CpaD
MPIDAMPFAMSHRKGQSMPARPLTHRRRSASLATLGLVAFALSACSTAPDTTSSTVPADYRLRHPIGLVNAPTDLDIFVGRNTSYLDPRQAEDIRTFALDFRRQGRGPMLVLVPDAKGGLPVANHGGVRAIRAVLAQSGVSSTMVQATSYAVPGDPVAAPVRLTFAKLQAKVMTPCGVWPADITGNVASVDGWQNRSYHNFGCAYQTVFANQVDDPIDLVRPRPETRSDVQRRMKVFDDARKSVDPSTAWKTGTASVSGGGGSSGGN